MSQPEEDLRFMAAALAFGRRGFGLCAPNPSVGALVVKNGAILARGWTKPGGRPHAETEALRDAGIDAKGATLYVTLEPCNHHGQTPPCTHAIIAAGIARVVYPIDDPDPRVSGSAARILQSAGIEVTSGVLSEEAKRAHLGHFLRVTNQRPMVHLKLAFTSDHYAAVAGSQERLLITSEPANGLVHVMRAMHDAIMIGVGTALADDPLLTVRLPGAEARKPLRIVLDSDLRLPLSSRLVATAGEIPTLAIAGEDASEERAARLRAAQVEIASARRGAAGRIDLGTAFNLLAARGLTRIFCEGGPRLASALIGEGLADEVTLLTSPKPLLGKGVGLDAVAASMLTDPLRYRVAETRMIGADKLSRYERVG
jgi:diaminohydroxyphosphoribosylaminopyrimidine deaminase / 5-amino-6-(5-phosphoribosylamino)uracil reductase